MILVIQGVVTSVLGTNRDYISPKGCLVFKEH